MSFSGDRKLFDNERIFRHHINELQSLFKEGITISNSTITKVKFVPHVFRGDNKSIKEAMGFVESFNTNFPCISCKVDRKSLMSQTEVDPALLRTKESILYDVASNKPSETGIKQNCMWMELENFCPSLNAAVDIMHDINEGVIPYDVSQCLYNVIKIEKLFDIDTLNNRIQNYKYDKGTKNKPEIITMENLKAKKLPFTAAESMLFLETLPFIIGDLIPERNKH